MQGFVSHRLQYMGRALTGANVDELLMKKLNQPALFAKGGPAPPRERPCTVPLSVMQAKKAPELMTKNL